MIYPFDSNKLAGASYEVAMRGEVIWWDEKEKKEHSEKLLKPEDTFRLEPNSIAFVTLEPMFRIPDYMALRFNLKIVHVYKGLLLGTGPLVDPGFVGRLSIPLHNLTANTYTFHAGDGIIQMEFTKLSRNDAWFKKPGNSTGLYKRKWIDPGRTLKQYLKRSLEGSSETVVKSSIPNELSKVKEKADSVEKEIERFQENEQKKFAEFQEKEENNFKDLQAQEQQSFKDFKSETEQRITSAQWINIAIFVSVMAFACTAIYQLGSSNTVKKEQIFELEKKYEQLQQDYTDMQEELNQRIDELIEQINGPVETETGKALGRVEL
jgi:deoxycytidine triphosphate deaminase